MFQISDKYSFFYVKNSKQSANLLNVNKKFILFNPKILDTYQKKYYSIDEKFSTQYHQVLKINKRRSRYG